MIYFLQKTMLSIDALGEDLQNSLEKLKKNLNRREKIKQNINEIKDTIVNIQRENVVKANIGDALNILKHCKITNISMPGPKPEIFAEILSNLEGYHGNLMCNMRYPEIHICRLEQLYSELERLDNEIQLQKSHIQDLASLLKEEQEKLKEKQEKINDTLKYAYDFMHKDDE